MSTTVTDIRHNNFITLLQKGIFLTARGQDINRQPNILYISTDCARSWHALHEFVDVRLCPHVPIF